MNFWSFSAAVALLHKSRSGKCFETMFFIHASLVCIQLECKDLISKVLVVFNVLFNGEFGLKTFHHEKQFQVDELDDVDHGVCMR